MLLRFWGEIFFQLGATPLPHKTIVGQEKIASVNRPLGLSVFVFHLSITTLLMFFRGFGYRINIITGVEDFEVKEDYMFASKRVVSYKNASMYATPLLPFGEFYFLFIFILNEIVLCKSCS